MNNFYIKIFYFAAPLIFLVMLTGCGSTQRAVEIIKAESGRIAEKPDNAKIRLKIFTQYSMDVDEKQPFDYAYAKMRAIQPEVELDIDIEPQDDSSKLKIYAASGTLPDIIQVTPSVIDLFRKSNNLLELDEFVKDTGIESRISPAYRNLLWSDDGHCYAVPRTAPSTHLLFYNKALFIKNGVKIPADYTEFLLAVKKFNSMGITPLALFAKETWPGVMLFEDFVTRYEPKGLTKINEGKGSLYEKAYLKAAEQLAECVDAGLLSQNAFTTDYAAAFEEFTGEKAAMFVNGCWALGPLADKLGDKIDYMDFPLADGDTVQATLVNRPGGGFDGGYSVTANTKYKDIAGKYTCLFSLEIANGRVVKAGAPNPLTLDGVKPERGYPAVSMKYMEQSKYFKTTTVFPWALNSKVSVIFGDNCAKLLTGGYPVEKFISDTDRDIKAALRD